MIRNKGNSRNFSEIIHMVFLIALFSLPAFIIIPKSGNSHHLSFDEIYLQPKIMWLYAVILPFSLMSILFNRKEIRLLLPVKLLLAFIIWLTVCLRIHNSSADLWGPPDRADGILMHLTYVILAITGFSFFRQKNLFWGYILLLSSTLALSNIGQQLHLYSAIGDSSQYTSYSGVSATNFGGLLGNRGYLGGLLSLLLPIVIWISATATNKMRIASNIGVILVVWAWAGTFTRGDWLAGLAGLLALLYFWRPAVKHWRPVVIGLLFFLTNTLLAGNARLFSLDGNSGQAMLDSSGRGVLWHSAIVGIQRKPLFGWGTYGLYQAMNSRSSDELLKEAGIKDIQSFINVRKPLNPWAKVDINTLPPHFKVTHSDGKVEDVQLVIDKVHNEFLDYALRYGIPAALLFTILLFYAIWSGWRVVPGVSAGLVAYAVYLFTWPEIIRFAPVAWFLMGVALAAGSVRRMPEAPVAEAT